MKKAGPFCVPLMVQRLVCAGDGVPLTETRTLHSHSCITRHVFYDAELDGYHADATRPMLCQCR